METLTIFDHVYVVALGLFFGIAVFKSQPKLAGTTLTTSEKLTLYWSNSIVLYLIALLAVLVWGLQGRELAIMGFRWPASENFAWYAALVVIFVVVYALDTLNNVLPKRNLETASKRWRHLTPFMPESQREVAHAMQLAFCAGVTEEIVFRGFLINYLCFMLTGQSAVAIENPLQSAAVLLAITVPATFFTLAHRYAGWQTMLKILALALLFGYIYVLSQSLVLVIVLHIFVDVVANAISPRMMRSAAATSAQTVA